MVAREEFGAKQLASVQESATTAMAAQAAEEVRAAYIMALQRPRDWDEARARMLRECERPTFAAVARYRKPIGQGIEGPSIRFAEAAIRHARNIRPTQHTIYDDAAKRIVRVTVTDLEANVSYSKEIVVDKLVERSKLRDGQVAISQRTNSAGKIVYLVSASEDDLLDKEGALVSKAIRTLALRIIPGDIIDECMQRVVETLNAGAAKDPDELVADAFASLGVYPKDLAEYLGHELAKITPAEITDLRALYAAIRDGEGTWTDALEARRGPRAEAAEEKTAATPEEKPRAAKLAEKIRGKAHEKHAAEEAPSGVAATVAAETAAEPARPAREPGED